MSHTLRTFWAVALVAVLSPCAHAQSPTEGFATSVIAFSSEYFSTVWSAQQALGPPNTYPAYGDYGTAWAPRTSDGQREYLVLGFSDVAPASGVSVYETYHPGAVDTVYVRNAATGQFVKVWQGTAAPALPQARIFTVQFPQTAFNVDAVRLAINSPAVPSWNEIDAVRIVNEAVPVSLTATTSTTVPQGGRVTFEYTVSNNTAVPQTGSVYFYAKRGTTTVGQGTVTTGTLPAGVSITRTYNQPIPGNAPPGGLNYYVCVGRSIGAPIQCSGIVYLTITNSVAGADDEARAADWAVADAAPWSVVDATLAAPARISDDAVAAYPNPFARSTEIAFTLAAASEVSLVVYDVRGRAVATLADGTMEAGRHAVTFDAAGLPSGVYVYRLVAGTEVQTGRVTLVR